MIKITLTDKSVVTVENASEVRVADGVLILGEGAGATLAMAAAGQWIYWIFTPPEEKQMGSDSRLSCAGCGGNPTGTNDPCAVCGAATEETVR